MVEGNGQKDSKVKWCPFLNEYCIAERCGLWTELVQNAGGLQRKVGMCILHALGAILSDIDVKTQKGIPRVFRG